MISKNFKSFKEVNYSIKLSRRNTTSSKKVGNDT